MTMPSVQGGAGGRVPPHALEAEQAVLGAILLDNTAYSTASESITSEMFYRKAHQDIFAAMSALASRGEAIDAITMAEEMRRQGTFQAAGGPAYLTELVGRVDTPSNVDHYARIVLEKYIMRRLITITSDIATQCFAGEREAATILDEAERDLYELSQRGLFKNFEPIGDIIRRQIKVIESIKDNDKHISGVPSPYPDLDALTAGFQKGDLVILAARPRMGKTSFALNLAQYLAIRENIPVGFFSLEMSAEQLVTRLLCSEARVDSNKVRRGYLNTNDYQALMMAAGYLSEAPIFIDDSSSITTLELRAKARRLKAEHDVGMLFIDYLQLITVRERTENRQQQISLISRSIKSLAKELAVPIVALSQLSRAVEARGGDHRPMLSDLRESGSLEQDADVVLFINRPEVYEGPDSENRGKAELIIGKQRNGPTGTIQLTFIDEYTRFEPGVAIYDDSEIGI